MRRARSHGDGQATDSESWSGLGASGARRACLIRRDRPGPAGPGSRRVVTGPGPRGPGRGLRPRAGINRRRRRECQPIVVPKGQKQYGHTIFILPTRDPPAATRSAEPEQRPASSAHAGSRFADGSLRWLRIPSSYRRVKNSTDIQSSSTHTRPAGCTPLC
jgi:hypothetical protein